MNSQWIDSALGLAGAMSSAPGVVDHGDLTARCDHLDNGGPKLICGGQRGHMGRCQVQPLQLRGHVGPVVDHVIRTHPAQPILRFGT